MGIGNGDASIGIAKTMRGKAGRCYTYPVDILTLRATAGNDDVAYRRTGDTNFVVIHRDIMDQRALTGVKPSTF